VKLTPEQLAHLVAERTYLNIHTAANQDGEIRGQIVKVLRKIALSGEAERPDPVETAGDGFGLLMLVRDELTFNLAYGRLIETATAAHIHGPAGFDEFADVLINLASFNGPGFATSGMLAGSLTLNAEHYRYLIDQQTYINVHTGVNPGGEIRGQITP
jgi:hypothetical protein